MKKIKTPTLLTPEEAKNLHRRFLASWPGWRAFYQKAAKLVKPQGSNR